MEGDAPSRSIFPWYISAFIALLFLTLGMYLCSLTSSTPWATELLAAVGFLLFGIALSLMCWASQEEGTKSGYLAYLHFTYIIPRDEADRLAPGTIPSLLCGLFQSLAQGALFFGFYYFPLGAGFTTCFVSGASLLSAVLAYFFYKETLSWSQVLGMMFCSSALVYLAILGENKGTVEAIICGSLALVFYSLRSLMAREAELEGMQSSDFSALLSVVDGFLGLILWSVLVILGFDIWIEGGQVYWAFIGGFAMAIGVYFLVQAIMAGFVGPSVSIANLTSVLIVIIHHQAIGTELDSMKIYSMVMAFSGVIFMVFGDDLLWLFGFNCCIARDALEVEEQVDEVPQEMVDELMRAQDRIE